jgi:hypothetical protein
VDLQTAAASLKLIGNDAYLNTSNVLVPLPVSAGFASYTHNWGDYFASTFTYSIVHLGSFSAGNSTFTSSGVSPYRQGQYAQANLVYTEPFWLKGETPDKPPTHSWQAGIEYLYGQKQAANGSLGHDDRLLFLMAITH